MWPNTDQPQQCFAKA